MQSSVLRTWFLLRESCTLSILWFAASALVLIFKSEPCIFQRMVINFSSFSISVKRDGRASLRWLYLNIYRERYMGLPQENMEAYLKDRRLRMLKTCLETFSTSTAPAMITSIFKMLTCWWTNWWSTRSSFSSWHTLIARIASRKVKAPRNTLWHYIQTFCTQIAHRDRGNLCT